ncbi:TolC family protein [Thermodesulfobacteriota bacterium]
MIQFLNIENRVVYIFVCLLMVVLPVTTVIAEEREIEVAIMGNKHNAAFLNHTGISRTADDNSVQVGLTADAGNPQAMRIVAVNDDSTAKSEEIEVQDSSGHNNTPPDSLELSLEDLIQLVREKNERIQSYLLEWEISEEGIKKERAIFEPDFVGTYLHEDNRIKNTAEEVLSRQFSAVYDEKNSLYNASIETLIPTGASLRLGYTMDNLGNNITQQLYGRDNEYRTFVVGGFTQPLLKNGGINATMANIRVAETDENISFQTYRQQMMLVVANAAAGYWDLHSAQEKLKARRESVQNAQRLLEDNRWRVKVGKMAESEILESEAGVDIRKSLESEAKQELVSAMNNLRTFFSSPVEEKETKIKATDQLEVEAIKPEFIGSVNKAIKLRPEYLSSLKKIDRTDIQIAYSKNQRYPQLDLKGSYGLNGLAISSRTSWDDAMYGDFPSWQVGLELRVPLTGDAKSRSELKAAEKRKEQALLELKAVEVATVNSVDTAIKSILSSLEQIRYTGRVRDLNRQLLEVEVKRLDAGKSNSRLVLEKEENYNRAIDAELESLIKYKRSILELRIAEGSLLSEYGIEIMEANE